MRVEGSCQATINTPEVWAEAIPGVSKRVAGSPKAVNGIRIQAQHGESETQRPEEVEYHDLVGPLSATCFQNQDTVGKTDTSVEAWLWQMPDAHVNTPALLKKRKRPSLSASPPQTPKHVRETSEELRELEIMMLTPTNGTSDPSRLTTPSEESEEGKPKAKKDKPPAGAYWIKQRLKQHNMYQGDDKALRKYPDLERQMRSILEGERNSVVKPMSASKLKEKHHYFRMANKETLLHHLIPCIIKERRSVVPQVSPETAGEVAEAPVSMVREYWDDGVVCEHNLSFRNTFLPIDDDLTKAMAKGQGLTNPRPDVIYGLSCDKYEAAPAGVRMSVETERMREIVPMMYDPMLVIEGESDRGEVGEAENQACRDGATLVNAGRLLRERIGEADVVGADCRTFVFSATLCPAEMEIWGHWAEVFYTDKLRTSEATTADGVKEIEEPYKQKHVVYHMNSLEVSSLRARDFLDKYRAFLHNILDWGCITRYTKLEEFYGRVYAWEKLQKDKHQKETKLAGGLKGGTPSSPSPPASNKRQ